VRYNLLFTAQFSTDLGNGSFGRLNWGWREARSLGTNGHHVVRA
jgi:hypothetical protein